MAERSRKWLISTIVPVYNAEATLRRCVDSILSQELPEDFSMETILVDDGSGDDSGRICDGYAGPDVKVIHQENGGLMRAWMAGVGIARGDFFFFVDSDDWIDRGMLFKMASEVKHDRTGSEEYDANGSVHSGQERPEEIPQIICVGAVEEHSGGRIIKRAHGADPGEYEGEKLLKKIKFDILGNTVRTVHFSRCMKLTAASLIRQNLHYCDPEIRMGEDMNIMLPALLDAERIVIIPDSFDYHYTYNDSSMAHGYDTGLTANTDRLMKVARAVLKDRETVFDTDTDLPENSVTEDLLGREMSYLCLLELRNELRNISPGQIRRIKNWAAMRHSHDQMTRFPVKPKGMAERLLIHVMKYPWTMSILVTGIIYRLWNRKHI